MKKNKTKKFDAIILSNEKEKNKLSNMSQKDFKIIFKF